MNNFTFHIPTKIIFGKDTELEAAKEIKELGAKRILLHYGSASAKKSGLVDRVAASIRAEGLYVIELGGVQPNPRLSLMKKGIDLCREEKIDFILAIGGGSVIDSSKAIAVGVCNPDKDLWVELILPRKPVEKCLPVGTILTISAAGSEMSNSMVTTNDDDPNNMIKSGYQSPNLKPVFSILNPELTYTLPRHQIANGCADIMMHSLERFLTMTTGNEMTDRIAIAVLSTIVKYGPVALEKPDDWQAQSEIMWAGSLSHNSLTNLGSTANMGVHQFGQEFSAMFDSTHGATLTCMWGTWARYVYKKSSPRRFAQLGEHLFGMISSGDDERDALQAIEQMERFFQTIEMPVNIGQLTGVLTDAQLIELTDKCTRNRTRKIPGIYVLDYEDVLSIYRAANH